MKTFYVDLSTFGLEVVAPTMTDALALVRAFRLGAQLTGWHFADPVRVSEKPTRKLEYFTMDQNDAFIKFINSDLGNLGEARYVND